MADLVPRWRRARRCSCGLPRQRDGGGDARVPPTHPEVSALPRPLAAVPFQRPGIGDLRSRQGARTSSSHHGVGRALQVDLNAGMVTDPRSEVRHLRPQHAAAAGQPGRADGRAGRLLARWRGVARVGRRAELARTALARAPRPPGGFRDGAGRAPCRLAPMAPADALQPAVRRVAGGHGSMQGGRADAGAAPVAAGAPPSLVPAEAAGGGAARRRGRCSGQSTCRAGKERLR